MIADDELDSERAVLADELQQRGDPHGELIALQLALEQLPETAHRTRRQAIERRIANQLDAHHDTFFGPLAPHVTRLSLPDLFDPALEVIRWRSGFADSVFLQRRLAEHEVVETLRLLPTVPVARFVCELVIGIGDHPAVVAELARNRPSTLRSLILNEWRKPLRRLRAIELGAMTDDIVTLLAALEHVELTTTAYRTFESATLQRLQLGIAYSAPSAIFDAQLPALRSLQLYGFMGDIGLADRYPQLEKLHLGCRAYDSRFMERLLVGPGLATMKSLTIGWGLTDTDLALAVRHADRLRTLEHLHLGGTFSPNAKAEALAYLPSLKFQ